MEDRRSGYRIAVVEDEAVQSRLFDENLGRFGYAVTVFGRGEEFLSSIRQGVSFDLVLLDQNLSNGITGLMTYESLRAFGADIPVIMASAYISPKLVFNFVKAGGDAYIEKPVEDWELLDWEINRTIEAYCNRKSLRELACKNRRLEEQKKIAEAFVDMISHELKTPLTVVLAGIQLLMDESSIASDVEAKSRLADIEQYAMRLSSFLDSLVRVCGTKKRRTIDTSPVELCRFLESAVGDIGRNFLRRKASLEIDCCCEGEVLVNKNEFFQVLLKLIDNAMKYSAGDAVVRITGQESQAKGFMDVLVSDNGIGMSEAELPFVFERFYRLDTLDEIRSTNGNGLGLYISKLLMEGMGGEIWVSSEKGKGTTFGLRLRKKE